MKLALIYEKFISRGGLEKYLYSFASELITNGHELAILTGETDAQTELLRNTEFHRLPRKNLRQFSAAAEAELAREVDADVSIGFGRTVAHDLHRAGGGCHRFYSDHVLHPLKRASAKNRVELALERELYTSGKTRHFVVNSEMVSDQLQEAYGVDPERITLIQTAVDSERFRPADSLDSRRAVRGEELSDENPVFLFVSMNHRRKGLDALLEAWPSAPEGAQLWIVGPELAPRHSRAIKKAKNGAVIRCFVQPDDLVPIYQAADFFIHPTLYDACANTVLQSMACGLPGIISANDGARQFIEDGRNGLQLPHPSDPDEIADKIRQMVGLSLTERQALAHAARETMLPLTWEAHVERWEKLITTIRSDRTV